jgi:acyl dehydratase
VVNFGGPRMINVGTTLEEKVFFIDRAMLKAYADASGDQNPIHQNEEFAKAVGLPNVIAHGMLTMALVGKYVTQWAGGSQHVKEFSGRFMKPVIVPADMKVDLTVSGNVVAVDGNQITLELSATSAGVKVFAMSQAVIVK